MYIVNSFLLVEYKFSWFSFVSSNHEIKVTMKDIYNKRNYESVLKPQIQFKFNLILTT